MKFEKLNAMIPYVVGGKQKILTMHPYNAITLAMPGRHAKDTDPIGGDFVVMVDDDTMDWTRHQFTHSDIFMDLEAKMVERPDDTNFLMNRYADIVVAGHDPDKISPGDDCHYEKSMHWQTLLYAVQCLAVAEHRRYAKYEAKFGGRYLPLRFSAGIVEGLWTAANAIERQRRGRPGVEWLEKEFGTPTLTKELML